VVWGDVTAASLITSQVVPWLAGVHESTLAGREIEIDMRTFATRFIDPEVTTRCDLCRPRKVARRNGNGNRHLHVA